MKSQIEPHSHMSRDQNLMLKGAIIYSGKTYREGSRILPKAREDYGPFYSRDVAWVQLIWDPY